MSWKPSVVISDPRVKLKTFKDIPEGCHFVFVEDQGVIWKKINNEVYTSTLWEAPWREQRSINGIEDWPVLRVRITSVHAEVYP